MKGLDNVIKLFANNRTNILLQKTESLGIVKEFSTLKKVEASNLKEVVGLGPSSINLLNQMGIYDKKDLLNITTEQCINHKFNISVVWAIIGFQKENGIELVNEEEFKKNYKRGSYKNK